MIGTSLFSSRRRLGSPDVPGGRAARKHASRQRRAAVFLSDLIGVICIFGMLFAGLFIGSILQ